MVNIYIHVAHIMANVDKLWGPFHLPLGLLVDKIWLTADTMGSSGSVFLFPAWHEFLIGGGNCWLVFVVKDGLKFGAAGSRGVICGIMRWGLLFSESQSSSSKFFNGKLISILIIESAKLIAHDWPMQRGFS